jgi:hypothetical protein
MSRRKKKIIINVKNNRRGKGKLKMTIRKISRNEDKQRRSGVVRRRKKMEERKEMEEYKNYSALHTCSAWKPK